MEAQKRGDRPSALDSNDRNEARAVVPRSLPIVRSRVLSRRAPPAAIGSKAVKAAADWHAARAIAQAKARAAMHTIGI